LTLAGSADFEIGKVGPALLSDLAEVTGDLIYGGTLNVSATGQPLSDGEVFNLFDAATFGGTFTAFNLPFLDPGLFWDTSNLTVDGTIIVIPEPGKRCGSRRRSGLLDRRGPSLAGGWDRAKHCANDSSSNGLV
jgi:hypothetical protein